MIKKCSFYFFLFISVFGEWCFAIQNAGIFPFATFPGNKKRVVLLGKDHHRKGWMDFGGKVDRGEETDQAAAREFHEESLGYFFSGIAAILNRLRSVLPVRNDRECYSMFPLKIPYKDLTDLKKKRAALVHSQGEWLTRLQGAEKVDFDWVYADDLRREIKKPGSNNTSIFSVDGSRRIILDPLLCQTLSTKAGMNMLHIITKRKKKTRWNYSKLFFYTDIFD